jgi:hypothetical protein
MIADDFFKKTTISFGNMPKPQFGNVDAVEFAQALRKLADAVVAGDVMLDEVRAITRSKSSDFVMGSLIIRYAEKR